MSALFHCGYPAGGVGYISQEPKSQIGKHTDSNSGGGECSIVFHPMFGDFPA
jgi:hypothetical protein